MTTHDATNARISSQRLPLDEIRQLGGEGVAGDAPGGAASAGKQGMEYVIVEVFRMRSASAHTQFSGGMVCPWLDGAWQTDWYCHESRTVKLPLVEQAIIPQRKVTEYLLSPTHRSGRDKARFFTHFGFSRQRWETLAEALRRHASEHDVTTTQATPFGMNYTIEGALQTPGGRTPRIRVVWFIETGEEIPRLATAYPLKESTS